MVWKLPSDARIHFGPCSKDEHNSMEITIYDDLECKPMTTIHGYKLVEYIGDSVYIGLDSIYGQLWIFTFNGDVPKNEICLEDDTLGNLIEAVRKFGYKWQINGTIITRK